MKIRLEIIKGFSLLLLLFMLVSAVAVSEDTYEITVTVVQNSSSEDGGDSNTVISTYDSEGGLTETTEIFGSASVVIPTGEDTIPTESTDSVDSNANGNPDPGIMPPNSNPDRLTYEERSVDEWWEWVLSTVTSEDIMLPPLPPVEDTIDFTVIGDFR